MKKWTYGVTIKSVRIMKKLYKALLCTFCATALFSCVQEEFEPTGTIVPEGYELQTFSVQTQSTRTTVEINADGTHGNTLWAKGDQLAIFWDGGKGTADLKGEGGSTTGSFTGAVEQGKKVNYAVYPSKIASFVEGTTVNVEIPAQQEGTFSAGNIAVAEVGNDNSISFNNLNAFLCVQLVSEEITKITIESVGGEPLVGIIPVTFEENDGKRLAVCGTVTKGDAKVTMTKAAGETGRYYVSIVPGVIHSEGLLMTYYKGEEVSGTYQLNQRLAPLANVIYNFGEFEPDFNYYVTKDGAGNKSGLTWRDAMPFAQMVDDVFEGPAWKDEAAYSCKKILADEYNGATFHIEEGEYEIDESWRALRYINDELVTLTFMGGYDKETHKRDLVNSKTEFTNKHGNNILDVDYDDGCSDMDITFDGIGFVNANMSSSKHNAAFYSYCANGNVSITIKNCHFTGNTHVNDVDGSNGAALLIFSVKNVTIENTVFANNEAVCAPAITIADTKATITNCRFENNEATQNAGVVYVNSGAKPTFNDCVFTGNKALKWGMVQHQSGTTTLNDCIFTKNTTDDAWDGGAIAVCKNSSGTVVINGGEISENHAGWGAAFYQDKLEGSKVATIYANDVLIKDNSSAASGAIWANGVTELTRCVLDGNTAGATGTGDATAIVVAQGANMSLYGCSVENHYAKDNANTIIIRDNASLYIGADSYGNRSLIKGNTAKFGGAIRVIHDKNKTSTSTLDVEATTFEGNTGQYGGAIIAYGPSDVNLYNGVVFKENYSSKGNGGAILFESNGTLTCNRCHFQNNRAYNVGGAIRVDNSSAKIYLNATTFKGNYHDGDPAGTTIQIHQANTFAMNNCTIADDTYTKKNHDSEPRISWLSFDEPQTLWMSNNTFIGMPWLKSEATYGGLVRIWLDVDTDAYFVNNIIVTSEEHENTWSFCQLNKSIDQANVPSVKLYHTKYSEFEYASACENAGYLTHMETPTSSGFTMSSFGDLEWHEDECYWSWNGTLTGGRNTEMINRDQFVSTIEEAAPEFKTWLESEGELERDQLGGHRGAADWWPGSYQGNAASSIKITTFNLRSSTMDESTDARKWSNRKAGVYEWFNTNQPAIVAAQECTDDQRNDILNNCTEYGAVWYERQASWWEQLLGKDVDAPVVTFYKKSDVTVKSSGTFWLYEGAPTSPKQASNQNQERCATWMKCTYKNTKMVVINAHLSYRTKDGDMHSSEAMQTLRQYEMDVITGWIEDNVTAADGPVVLLGDFNIDQGNAIFNYYKNGTNGFYHGRAEAAETDMGRTFNNWYPAGDENWSKQQTIDHQFFKGFTSIDSYLVDRNTYADVEFISDHWPLTAVYKF